MSARNRTAAPSQSLNRINFFVRQPGCILDSLLNIVLLKVWITAEDLFNRCAMGDLTDDYGHADPHSANRRPAAVNLRVECNAIKHSLHSLFP